jgi:hypothetical protein
MVYPIKKLGINSISLRAQSKCICIAFITKLASTIERVSSTSPTHTVIASRRTRCEKMKIPLFLILPIFASVGLAECSVHSVDCVLGTPHSDCAPDTAGHRAALEELRTKQMTESIDDARCQSYGLRYGSPSYSQCRANLDKQRVLPEGQ